MDRQDCNQVSDLAVHVSQHAELLFRSCAKLAYSNAQSVIDGNGLPESVQVSNGMTADGISEDIKAMWASCMILAKLAYSHVIATTGTG